MAKTENFTTVKVTASAGYEYVNGKRKQVKKTETIHIPTSISNNPRKVKAYIERERARIRKDLDTQKRFNKSEVTFREYAKMVADRKRMQGDVRIITEQTNNSILVYLNSIVGDYKIKDIDKSIVDMVKSEINNKPSDRGGTISDKTKYNYFSYFRSIINAAHDDNYYNENPISKVRNFRFETGETSYLEKEELIAVMRDLSKLHIKEQVEILLEFSTGTRRGEVLGLRWNDIIKDSRGLYFDLKEGYYYAQGKGYFRGTLKTKDSRRALAIHGFLLQKLEELKAWQDEEKRKWGDAWKGAEGYIICKDDGSPYHPDHYSKRVRKIFEKLGYDDITTHSLRRSFATLANRENETTSKISDLLGHSSIMLTDKCYIRRSKGAGDVSFLDTVVPKAEKKSTPGRSLKRIRLKR